MLHGNITNFDEGNYICSSVKDLINHLTEVSLYSYLSLHSERVDLSLLQGESVYIILLYLYILISFETQIWKDMEGETFLLGCVLYIYYHSDVVPLWCS